MAFDRVSSRAADANVVHTLSRAPIAPPRAGSERSPRRRGWRTEFIDRSPMRLPEGIERSPSRCVGLAARIARSRDPFGLPKGVDRSRPRCGTRRAHRESTVSITPASRTHRRRAIVSCRADGPADRRIRCSLNLRPKLHQSAMVEARHCSDDGLRHRVASAVERAVRLEPDRRIRQQHDACMRWSAR